MLKPEVFVLESYDTFIYNTAPLTGTFNSSITPLYKINKYSVEEIQTCYILGVYHETCYYESNFYTVSSSIQISYSYKGITITKNLHINSPDLSSINFIIGNNNLKRLNCEGSEYQWTSVHLKVQDTYTNLSLSVDNSSVAILVDNYMLMGLNPGSSFVFLTHQPGWRLSFTVSDEIVSVDSIKQYFSQSTVRHSHQMFIHSILAIL